MSASIEHRVKLAAARARARNAVSVASCGDGKKRGIVAPKIFSAARNLPINEINTKPNLLAFAEASSWREASASCAKAEVAEVQAREVSLLASSVFCGRAYAMLRGQRV